MKEALGFFITPYSSGTNSFPGGSQEVETSFGLLHPLLYLVEQIHFQEALKRLKEVLGLSIPSYISRTRSFPGGSQEAETCFGPLHPLLYLSNKFISRRLSRG